MAGGQQATRPAWFTVDDLKYLRRGGRIGAMAATVGTMLDLKPHHHRKQGRQLVSSDKVRGRKAALRLIADKAAENIDDPAQAMTIILHATPLRMPPAWNPCSGSACPPWERSRPIMWAR